MHNYNDDSDEEFDYDLSGDHMAGNNSQKNAEPISYTATPVVQDFVYENPNPQNEDDLEVEDNWNFDLPSSSQPQQQPTKTKSKRQELLDAQKDKLK